MKKAWAYAVADILSRFLDFVQAEKSWSLESVEYKFIRFWLDQLSVYINTIYLHLYIIMRKVCNAS